MLRPFLLAATTLLAATPAIAGSFQDTVALDRAVAAFAGRGVGDDGGPRTAVDARLRLAQCPTVSLSWRTSAHDAVVVACSGPEWRIYVPMRMVAGAPAATAVAPTVAALAKAPPVIRRGDPVVIEAGSEGFAISREGVAIGDAAPGARFLVKVEDTRAPVQAIAVAGGRATLPGWGE